MWKKHKKRGMFYTTHVGTIHSICNQWKQNTAKDWIEAVARRNEVNLDGKGGDSTCGDVESAVDDREERSLVIVSAKKDANFSPVTKVTKDLSLTFFAQLTIVTDRRTQRLSQTGPWYRKATDRSIIVSGRHCYIKAVSALLMFIKRSNSITRQYQISYRSVHAMLEIH